MNNQIQVFKNSDYDVRTQIANNEVWFCLVDVARILKLTSYRKTADNLRKSQRCIFNIQPQGDTIFINESGLYRILLRSRKKEAESFQIWVEDEVLPVIRKTGSYQAEKPKILTVDQILELNSQTIIKLQARNKHLEMIVSDESEKVPAKTMRSQINEVIRNYAKTEGIYYHYIWNRLYKEFKYTYNIDLKTRAEHSKKSKIDEAEKAGKLTELWQLSLKMFEI